MKPPWIVGFSIAMFDYQRVPNLDSSRYLPVLLYHLVLDFWVYVLMDKRLVDSCISSPIS